VRTEQNSKADTSNKKPLSTPSTNDVKDKDEKSNPRRSANTRFIDRDGDGLRDGQEHRFRGRYRRDQDRDRESGETHTNRVVRARYRYGINNTNGSTVGPQCRHCTK
jgi:hypothetical protein